MSSPKHSGSEWLDAPEGAQARMEAEGPTVFAWPDEPAAAPAGTVAVATAPQPAKASQGRLTPKSITHDYVRGLERELERVKQINSELLAAAKAALDYATDVCPSSALPYEAKLKAAIAAAEGRAL